MLLSALLLATTVQAAPTPSTAPAWGDQVASGRAMFYGSRQEALDAAKALQACQAPGVELAVNVAPATQLAVKKLGDLPLANHTLTVLRRVDGCPVSSTVRYNVGR